MKPKPITAWAWINSRGEIYYGEVYATEEEAKVAGKPVLLEGACNCGSCYRILTLDELKKEGYTCKQIKIEVEE